MKIVTGHVVLSGNVGCKKVQEQGANGRFHVSLRFMNSGANPPSHHITHWIRLLSINDEQEGTHKRTCSDVPEGPSYLPERSARWRRYRALIHPRSAILDRPQAAKSGLSALAVARVEQALNERRISPLIELRLPVADVRPCRLGADERMIGNAHAWILLQST